MKLLLDSFSLVVGVPV